MKINTKGFSLIELLVALSILAVVAAIIVPRFLNVRQQAAETTARAQMKTIEHACQQFISLGGTLSANMGDNLELLSATSINGAARATVGNCKDVAGTFGSTTISITLNKAGAYADAGLAKPQGFYWTGGGAAAYCDGAGTQWDITVVPESGKITFTPIANSATNITFK